MSGRRHDVLSVITSTDRRGAETFAVGLGAALEARGRSVHTVALASGTSDGALPLPTLGPSTLAPRTLAALRRASRDAAVVVAHGSRALPACALATTGRGQPLVYRNIGDPRYWAGGSARRLRVSLFLRRTQAVVVLDAASADAIMERHGVPASRICVIPTGVRPELFPLVDAPRRDAARQRLGYDHDARIVAYIGALSWEKDVGAAVLAVASLPGVRLAVVGDGPQRGAVTAAARGLAPGRVDFLGPVVDPALTLAAADVLVLPSRTEGIPAVLIEAGLSGLPVVATDVGGVREVVVHEETGLLVAPGDATALAGALQRAMANGHGMGAAARERCLARFDMATIAARWDDLLGRLLGG
jgi:glycosyltransferase involved in cell wall biosynthesis